MDTWGKKMLFTEKENLYIIYDSNDNNRVVGMLNSNLDKDAHDALNPDHIRISSNTIESPEGQVLYPNQVQVNSEGVASKI